MSNVMLVVLDLVLLFLFHRAPMGASSGVGQSGQHDGSFVRDATAARLQPRSVRPVSHHRRDPIHPIAHPPPPSAHDRTLPTSSPLFPTARQPGPQHTEPVALRHQPTTNHPVAPDDGRPGSPPLPSERDGKRSHDAPAHTASDFAFRRIAANERASDDSANAGLCESGKSERASDAPHGRNGEVRVHGPESSER